MGFENKFQKKRVRFTDPTPTDDNYEEDVDSDIESGIRVKIDDQICDNGNGMKLVLGIPVNIWGTHIRGQPANPSDHPNNKLAATWTAPQLMLPEDDCVNSEGGVGLVNEHIEDQNKKVGSSIEIPGSPPRVQQSGQDYTVEISSSSVSASASTSKCKVPSAPSSTYSAKILKITWFIWAQIESFLNRVNRWRKAADHLVENFWDHLKLGGNISEAIWGKLRLGAKIVTEGGVDNLFKLTFSVGPREKLLKTSACYLSTTTGPVVGLLFISTEKLAFCSDRPLSFMDSTGVTAWSYYRVVIPVGRLRSVNLSENIYKPAEKYIEIQTVDNHEFWFMGFVNYQKALRYLQEVVRSPSSSKPNFIQK